VIQTLTLWVLICLLAACNTQEPPADHADVLTDESVLSAPAIESFSKQFGEGDFNYADAVAWASDGTILAAFSSYDGDVIYDIDQMDASIMKIDGTGNMLWRTTLGGPNQDNFRFIFPDDAGGCLLVGRYDENRPGEQYAQVALWIVKINSEGSVEWEKTISREGSLQIFSATRTQNQLILGGQHSPNSLDGSAILMILDLDGNLVIEMEYASSKNIWGISHISGDRLVLGSFAGSYPTQYGFVRCVDFSGATLWSREYPELGIIYSADELADGELTFFSESYPDTVVIARADDQGGSIQASYVFPDTHDLSEQYMVSDELYWCMIQPSSDDSAPSLNLYCFTDDGPQWVRQIDTPMDLGSTTEYSLSVSPDGHWLAILGHAYTESGQNSLVWLTTLEI